ncbi:MAG: hypothetical protein FD177_1699 [Desulfovibrionaceae bacterium]|nr:MAG: hypothetical protein FD177_1699 [Desulfovibrionaceae bacterium]
MFAISMMYCAASLMMNQADDIYFLPNRFTAQPRKESE